MDISEELKKYEYIMNIYASVPPGMMNVAKLLKHHETCTQPGCTPEQLRDFRITLTAGRKNADAAMKKYTENKALCDRFIEWFARLEQNDIPAPVHASDTYTHIYKDVCSVRDAACKAWRAKDPLKHEKSLETHFTKWENMLQKLGNTSPREMLKHDALDALIKECAAVYEEHAESNVPDIAYHVAELGRALQHAKAQQETPSCEAEGCDVTALRQHLAYFKEKQQQHKEEEEQEEENDDSSSAVMLMGVSDNEEEEDDDDDDDEEQYNTSSSSSGAVKRKRHDDDDDEDALAHVIEHFDQYQRDGRVLKLLKYIHDGNRDAFHHAITPETQKTRYVVMACVHGSTLEMTAVKTCKTRVEAQTYVKQGGPYSYYQIVPINDISE